MFSKTHRFITLSSLVFALACTMFLAGANAAPLNVTRATLANGLRVIVVRDPLAPVVTTVLNYRAGSDEQQFPGQAHALEHVMFRGSRTLSESQLADISELLGGDSNADTQGEITQYFFSVPAQYLDVALRLEASRARGLTISQKNWSIERGAILNEVTQDDSIAIQRLFQRTILPSIFKGTAYAHDTLGTTFGFKQQINSPQLLAYYKTWYHPNNAVYVISGDVDGPATIAAVKKYFGPIPAATLPARAASLMQAVKPATYRVDSDQPYSLLAAAYRLPGYQDKDYAAAQILESVLNNQRGDVYGLVASGKALYAGFQDIESHPHGTAAAALMVVPITTNADKAILDLQGVLAAYRRTGVPANLVAVAKQRAVADAEFRGNSIQGLAFAWSDAVAKAGLNSPDDALAAIKRVTVDDVNRVLRTYVLPERSIVAFAVPKNIGKINQHPPSGPAKESNKITLLHHDPLPAWAVAAFKNSKVPEQLQRPIDTRLSNGMRLIVIPEHVTHTVVVRGAVQSNEAIQAPSSKLGVADITSSLFSFGTTSNSRLQLREELDAIAAEVSAGTSFSLDALSGNFERGVQILADEELHPAFPATDFKTVQGQAVGALTGAMTAPDHLAEVALNKALYPATDPLQRFATPATAGAVSLDDVKSFYHSVYRPDATTVVVVGDVTPALAKRTFEKYFAAWSAQGPKPDVALPAVPNNVAASADVPALGRVQSQVELVEVLGLRRSDPDWAQIALANAVLGQGGSSILFHDLRDVHGYVYGAGSSFSARKNRSTFAIDFASDPDKILPAQNLALTDLRHLLAMPLSTEELVRGKTMAISDIPLRAESFDGLAGQLLGYAALGLPLDQATRDARREFAASPGSVRAALVRWIRPKDFVRIITGPAPK